MKMDAGIMAGMVNYTIYKAFLETGHFVHILQAYGCNWCPVKRKKAAGGCIVLCIIIDVQDMTTLQPSL